VGRRGTGETQKYRRMALDLLSLSGQKVLGTGADRWARTDEENSPLPYKTKSKKKKRGRKTPGPY